MNTENTRPIVKQISEVERHISECEGKIDHLQKQHNMPAEWFTEQFNADIHQFDSDAAKSAYQQINRYHAEINVYLKKIGLTREVLKSISNQITNGEADAEDVKISVVEEHLKLVVSITRNMWDRTSGVEFLDVIHEGNAGLISAIDNFDYQRGYQFKTYAQWWIRQNVTRAIAGQGTNSEC